MLSEKRKVIPIPPRATVLAEFWMHTLLWIGRIESPSLVLPIKSSTSLYSSNLAIFGMGIRRIDIHDVSGRWRSVYGLELQPQMTASVRIAPRARVDLSRPA
jgi:hypothetical protein